LYEFGDLEQSRKVLQLLYPPPNPHSNDELVLSGEP
jgi:hypothetical protein